MITIQEYKITLCFPLKLIEDIVVVVTGNLRAARANIAKQAIATRKSAPFAPINRKYSGQNGAVKGF